jgi:hypothetical protein
MKYYFVEAVIAGTISDRKHTHSMVFEVDENMNPLEAFEEIKKRIEYEIKETSYILDHISEFREL